MPRTAPISHHPVFPVLTAGWFALLLGGGMFVMPGSLVNDLGEATGLSDMLGAEAAVRAVLAVLAAVIGLVFGLLIGRLATRSTRRNPLAVDAWEEPEADTGRESAHDRAPEMPLHERPAPEVRVFNAREELAEDWDDVGASDNAAAFLHDANVRADEEADELEEYEMAEFEPVAEDDTAPAAPPAGDRPPLEELSLAELLDRVREVMGPDADMQETASPDPAPDDAGPDDTSDGGDDVLAFVEREQRSADIGNS